MGKGHSGVTSKYVGGKEADVPEFSLDHLEVKDKFSQATRRARLGGTGEKMVSILIMLLHANFHRC